jgi:uncharacterized protein (TIGR02271 family)
VTTTGSVQNPSDAAVASSALEEEVIPLLTEQISVERKRVETGRVIATVATHHHEHVIKEVLVSERVEVERVPIGRIVEAVPSVREEGDTKIIPVVEEVLVIERRLILKEEVHLRRVRVRETHAASVMTRTQDVVVTRSEDQPPSATDHADRDYNPKERTMNEETIVAVYDSPEQADAAMRDLIAANVLESAISRHGRTANGMTSVDETRVAEPVREEGFWSRLFGGDHDHDHDVYDRSIESGSTVISVHVPDADVLRVSEILDRHSPIDIDERASRHGFASTTEAGTAGVPPVGYAETRYDGPIPRSAETGVEDIALPVGRAYETTGSDLTETVPAVGTDIGATGSVDESETLRLAEERLTIGKRLVNRGGTRVRRYVVETPVEEQVTLHDERVTLDRRPVTGTVTPDAGSFTDRTIEMAETREEAVVSKTAYVTEEVRLRKEAVDRVETVRDTVRREEVEIERLPEETVATPRP